jgi:hypothetical protein
MAQDAPRQLDRRDALTASLAGGLAAIAYARTLAPGLSLDTDAPVFQLVGRVLGVPHNPGYPLYVLLTWPIAQIPIGSLAWRINVFSAVAGAAAVALTALAARLLGASRVAAGAAGLGFGLGGTFWAQAVIAEVYTLNALLVAGVLAAAFAWARTGRPACFFAAVGCVAAGLAHHTTIAAFVPALAVLALWRDRRFATSARTLAVSVAILALGLLPYLLVLVRSQDPQAYVESRATTLPELVQVVLGRQFQDRLLAEPLTRVLAERVPLLIRRVIVADLTPAGLALAAVGLVWLVRRRRPEALFLAAAAVPIAVFAATYAVVDTPVFLLPVLQTLWVCAAVGLDQIGAGVAALVSRRAVVIRGAVAVAACALPLWLVARHASTADRSGDYSARPLERLFDVLPDRAAIVSADFITDRLLHYLLRGEAAARGRDIRIAPRDAASIRALAASGVSIVALPGAAERLRLDGLDFSAAAVPVFDGSFGELVGHLPRGAVVALAVPAAHRGAFERGSGAGYAAIGAARAWEAAGALAVVGVVGGEPAPRAEVSPVVDLSLAPGVGPWSSGRAVLEVQAAADVAAVRLGGRDLLRTQDGAALAVWGPDGRLLRAHGLQAANGFLVPLPPGALSVYPLLGTAPDTTVPPGAWVDVTAAASTGSVTVDVPAGSRLELRAEDDAPLSPRIEVNRGHGRVAIATAPSGTSTLTIAAEPAAPTTVWLSLGGVPRRAMARVEPAGTGAVQIRPVATTGLLDGPDRRSSLVTMTRGEPARAIGAGWSSVETDDAGAYRWMTGPRARVVLTRAEAHWRAVRVEAFCPGHRDGATLTLSLGPHALPPRPLVAGWAVYEWEVPEEAARALAAGPVDVSLEIGPDEHEGAAGSADPRLVAVASLRFTD